MERYICIHGHFYQPPRENPWLETIELQDSAYPYHDWNERIAAECYAPNSASRVLSAQGKITRIVDNYARISFNLGPTLLAWMQDKAPDVYEAILEADRQSRLNYSGHGSALAQVYNHMIMPLANTRDQYTQVRWGIEDFKHRFGREPEGLWLAETAVDIASLEILAEQGIKFTILSPYQAYQVRESEDDEWEDVTGGRIDPTRPYRINLPSGRTLTLFFYDGPISRAIAFERLLSNGVHFAERLVGAFNEEREWPQLVHIATDGETYGHHHHRGDMALAYALEYIEREKKARLTNYGEYLEKHPPEAEVEIYENTAWSCAHGVGRWQENCGCNSGAGNGWTQAWRAPLRDALDWLRDRISPLYAKEALKYIKDPWEARNEYIHVILDRSSESMNQYFSQHGKWDLTEEERVKVLKLQELQRHAMLMYTSCGWFFDELSGIETVQVIQYAGRVIQLASEFWKDSIETEFLDRLEKAQSNIPDRGNGREIFEKFVRPSMVDLPKVAAHYALSSIFEQYEENTRIFHYHVNCKDYRIKEIGPVKLVVGRADMFSEITCETDRLSFGVLHLGDHNLYAGVRQFQGEAEYERMLKELTKVFSKGEFAETIRYLDRSFGTSTYSLKQLFRDEQRKIIDMIMETASSRAELLYRQFYEPHVPMMNFLSDIRVPLPRALQTAIEFVLNTSLKRELQQDDVDFVMVRNLMEYARQWNVNLDRVGLGHAYTGTLNREARQFAENPHDLEQLRKFREYGDLLKDLPFETNLWKPQNTYYESLQTIYPLYKESPDETAQEWVQEFETLGDRLWIEIQ